MKTIVAIDSKRQIPVFWDGQEFTDDRDKVACFSKWEATKLDLHLGKAIKVQASQAVYDVSITPRSHLEFFQ